MLLTLHLKQKKIKIRKKRNPRLELNIHSKKSLPSLLVHPSWSPHHIPAVPDPAMPHCCLYWHSAACTHAPPRAMPAGPPWPEQQFCQRETCGPPRPLTRPLSPCRPSPSPPPGKAVIPNTKVLTHRPSASSCSGSRGPPQPAPGPPHSSLLATSAQTPAEARGLHVSKP